MLKYLRNAVMATTVLAMGAIAGCSVVDKDDDESPEVRQAQLDALEVRAENTLKRALEVDPGLKRFNDSAYGIVIFPNVGKGGFIVGGAKGDGVVYEQGKVVGYAVLMQGTVGLQIGGQAYSQLIFLKDETDLERFKEGDVEFEAEASAVAVKSGASAKVDYSKGVAVFALDEQGLMAQAAIGGQKFEYVPKE